VAFCVVDAVSYAIYFDECESYCKIGFNGLGCRDLYVAYVFVVPILVNDFFLRAGIPKNWLRNVVLPSPCDPTIMALKLQLLTDKLAWWDLGKFEIPMPPSISSIVYCFIYLEMHLK